MLKRVARAYGRRSRERRASLFHEYLRPGGDDRILDLGSEDGTHIASIVDRREGVYIADISPEALERGRRKYGFETVLVPEDGSMPFPDGYFDIVFCSSVIEHVTVDKADAGDVRSGRAFAEAAFARQRRFADEISRVGRRYFVQTPNRWFPIESHTWLPGVGLLPRRVQVPLIRALNRFWVKRTAPDWHLLTKRQMSELFPDADIVSERSLGMTKSLIAVRR